MKLEKTYYLFLLFMYCIICLKVWKLSCFKELRSWTMIAMTADEFRIFRWSILFLDCSVLTDRDSIITLSCNYNKINLLDTQIAILIFHHIILILIHIKSYTGFKITWKKYVPVKLICVKLSVKVQC